jgi:peptide/nickel transport system substrate-binding protein
LNPSCDSWKEVERIFGNVRVCHAAIVLGLIWSLIVTSCASSPSAREEETEFIFAQAADATKMDPADVTDGESIRVCSQLYDGLVKFSPGTTSVEPNLATGWTTSEDGLVWEFTLREDVKFHDGTPFNADAVVYNVERQFDPTHPQHTGDFDYWLYMFGGFKGDVAEDGRPSCVIGSVEAVDEYAVRFSLTRPFGPFIQDMAMFFMYMISPAALQEQGENYGLPGFVPVGTGPFKFVEWVEDDHITLERYDDYHGQVARVDKTIIRVIPDSGARYRALQAGDIQGMCSPDIDDLLACESDAGCQVLLRPANTTAFVNVMTDRQPWDDVRVRKALSLAIDKQAIVDALYDGLGEVAGQFVPPALWGYDPDIDDYGYDPDEARRLLREAGVEEGFTFDFWYLPNPRPYYPVPEDIAEAIASYWTDVGLNPQLKTEDLKTYLEDRAAGKFDIWMIGWTADNGDPDSFFCSFVCTPTPREGNWNSEKAQEAMDLLLKAQALSDHLEREPLYFQAAELVHDDVPRLFIAHTHTPLLLSANVRGYVPHALAESGECYNTLYLAAGAE